MMETQRVTVESIFTDYMKKTISVRDTFVKKATKENFYHGILLGILGFNKCSKNSPTSSGTPLKKWS
ncbi:hypothetical protein DW061_22810 [Ruminococcus sp. AF42-9BH]|nr:hypothetical protein DW061_22810 [Ruminococcus sp. AF42-9BH]